MKLGLIRTSGPHSTREDHNAISMQLALADTLGFDLAYFPKLAPTDIEGFKKSCGNDIHIGLDASALGSHSLDNLEAVIRGLNESLDGRLCLGVQMRDAETCGKLNVEAQKIETMLSHDPKHNAALIPSRFPMKPPHPRMLGMPTTGSADEAALSAARGYSSLTPSWLSFREAASHWPAIIKGATSALRRACLSQWQLARNVVVHDDPAVLEAYVFGTRSPIRAYYSRLTQHGLIAPNVEEILEKTVIYGSAEKVSGDILALREVVGEVGTLNCLIPPGCDPEITQNTMIRLAEDIIPTVTTAGTNTTKELERT
ncbi:MAG: hypothetical protein ABJ327_06805 [Litoreibacter sp.]